MTDLSPKLRSTLTQAEKAIQRVPAVYRKELCDSLKNKFENPLKYVFRHTDMNAINAFQEISLLFNSLCDRDKELFVLSFSELSEKINCT